MWKSHEKIVEQDVYEAEQNSLSKITWSESEELNWIIGFPPFNSLVSYWWPERDILSWTTEQTNGD